MITRPVLLGMNNPLSENPSMALFPAPSGAAGWRLWRMLADAADRRAEESYAGDGGVTRFNYLSDFDRRNLLDSKVWDARLARDRASDILESLPDESRVVLVGTSVLKATRLPRVEWFEWRSFQWLPELGLRYTVIPHPSGRNLLYNDPEFRDRTGNLLLDLWLEYRAGVPETIRVAAGK